MRILLVLCVLVMMNGCGPKRAESAAFQSGKADASAQSPALSEAQGRTSAQRPAHAETLDPFTWDFGQVTAEKKLEHTFVFTNKSKKTLELTGTGTSCHCTAAALEKTTLAPGESAQLKVTFDPRGYHGPATQHAYLNTDDPDNPVYKFTILAQVAP